MRIWLILGAQQRLWTHASQLNLNLMILSAPFTTICASFKELRTSVTTYNKTCVAVTTQRKSHLQTRQSHQSFARACALRLIHAPFAQEETYVL